MAERCGYTVQGDNPIAIVWHNDALREHVANLCSACHPPDGHLSDCYICVRAALLDVT